MPSRRNVNVRRGVKKKVFTHEEHHEELMVLEKALSREILSNWYEKETEDVKNRKSLSRLLVFLLVAQLIVVNLIIIAIGFWGFEIDSTVVIAFITGTFVELTALLGVVFAYMFKDRSVEPLRIVVELYENINRHNHQFHTNKVTPDQTGGEIEQFNDSNNPDTERF